MKPKTIVLMVVAIVCGLGASYMTSRLLAERNTEVREAETVAVLVAKKNLDQNQALKEKQLPDLFEEKQFTKGQEPEDALNSLEQLKNKFLKHNLRRGDVVKATDITEEALAIDLQKGMLAVGLRVNLESIAGGFASLPGSRVNIYATVRRATDDESQSILLLENILVLAADTRSTKSDNSAAMPASVVTVALNPDDVLRVNMAKEFGSLSLALRRMGDNSKTELHKFTGGELFRISKRGSEVAIGNSGELGRGTPLPEVQIKTEVPKVEYTPVAPKIGTRPEAPKAQPQPEAPKGLPNVETPKSEPKSAPRKDETAPAAPGPFRQPYTIVMTVGDRTVTKTVELDENGEVVLHHGAHSHDFSSDGVPAPLPSVGSQPPTSTVPPPLPGNSAKGPNQK
jgi:Flp pilus assembly protein CpaB